MDALGASFIGIVLIAVLIAIIPLIFFIITIQTALKRCSPSSRETEPGTAWFLLIPVFNIVWQFLLVSKLSESFDKEFELRKINKPLGLTKNIGFAYCILGLCGWIPFLGILASLAALVCWIMYWVQVAGLSSELVNPYNDANIIDAPTGHQA